MEGPPRRGRIRSAEHSRGAPTLQRIGAGRQQGGPLTATDDKRYGQQPEGVWEPPPPTGSAWPGRPPIQNAASGGSRTASPSSANRPKTGPYAQAASQPYPGQRTAPCYDDAQQAPRPGQPVTSDEFAELCRTIGSSVAQVSEAVGKAISESVVSGVKAAKQAKAQAPANPRPVPAKGAGWQRGPMAPTGSPFPAAPYAPQNSTKAELKRRDAIVNSRFKKPGGLQASGVAFTTVGAVTTLVFSGTLAGIIATADTVSAGPTAVAAIMVGGFLAASVTLLATGIRQLQAAGHLQSFRRIFGTREACSIDEMAAQLHQSRAKTLKQARSILKRGLLPQGHIDDEGTTLMVTDNAYRHYRQLQASQRQAAQAPGQAVITDVADVMPASRTAASAAGAGRPQSEASESLPPKARAFVEQGQAYLGQLRKLDDDIADAAVSAKIASIEQVVAKILERAQAHPAAVDDLGRLMDYYLPTTVKLLEAYDSLEEQPVQGSNIASSRREIEQTLDVLQTAFEKLLDATFEDLSFDVSSDISVLNTILAQEGLTESPFGTPSERNAQ